MLVPLKWLMEYVDIDIGIKELCDRMTMTGSNVEDVREMGKDITGVVVGKILDIKSHPNADKLVISKVDIGNRNVQIVTGATNISVGDLIPVALDGAVLHKGLKIHKGEIRGEMSEGMLCSQEELGIDRGVISENSREGIWILNGNYTLGENLKDAIDLEEDIIEFEITSNRPDCLSMIGMAREVAATLNTNIRHPKVQLKESTGKASDIAKVIIEDTAGCGRYLAKVIKDVKIEPSPDWMQRRLANAGIRPINNIVDITNYVMLEYGQPLHAFDLDYISDNTIIVKKGKRGRTFTTLDGDTRKLKDYMTMICDSEKELAIAGVMGGKESEITYKTKTILLESAYFDPEGVRLTSKQLGLRTEASSRYEKGLDPNTVEIAAKRACQLIEELGAGVILQGSVDVYPSVKEASKRYIKPKKINSLLGTNLSKVEIMEILERLELYTVDKGELLHVTIPTYRLDLDIEEDFAEEVGRIYGFDNIPSTMPKGSAEVGGRTKEQTIRDITKKTLNSMGLYEILTYSFISPEWLDKIRLGDNSIRRNFVPLLNPLGDETSAMRTSLLPNLLEVMKRNYNRKVDVFRAFELGRIFIPKANKPYKLPNELLNLAIGLYGTEEDFYTLKGRVETLLLTLGIKNYHFVVEKYHPSYHPGRCGNIVCGDHIIGTLGELHPSVIDNYDIGNKCYCAELDFELIMDLSQLGRQYKPLPKYPAIVRDFAVVIDKKVLVKEIESIIRDEGKDILESYQLFDIYEGDQIAQGYKSVAYTITYRHESRTLKDEEANDLHDKIVNKIKDELGGILRD